MKDAPYFPFFQRDFVHSCRSSGMTPEEMGALLMVMCQQWETMGSLPDDPERFAAYSGWSKRTSRRLLDRLSELGKIERAGGSISSSRMTEEIARFKERSAAAKEREERKRSAVGSTKFALNSVEVSSKFGDNSKETQAKLFEKPKEINDREGNGAPLPESRIQNHKIETPIPPEGARSDAAVVETAFEKFWTAFPDGRKRGKGEVKSIFVKIVNGRHRKGLRATAAELVAAAERYAAARPDPEYTPMPATWLNQGRWLDNTAEAAPAVGPNGAKWDWWKGREEALRARSIDAWEGLIERNPPNGKWPWWALGPPPGGPDCLLPQTLIDAHGYAAIYQGQIEHD